MPIHDWTRVPSGLFHDFHQSWSIRIKDALNRGLLPRGLAALVEQPSGPIEPDVLVIETPSANDDWSGGNGGVALLDPPQTQIVRRTDAHNYADRANRIVVTHHLGRIVAVIEIVSPGKKDGRPALRKFVEKTVEFLNAGIHALIVDLFPPTSRDPAGIHKAIWDEIVEEEFEPPAGKDRTLVSYETGLEQVAYIEPVAVGDDLPDMPLFLSPGMHVAVPLQSSYDATWNSLPEVVRNAVETGVLPAIEE